MRREGRGEGRKAARRIDIGCALADMAGRASQKAVRGSCAPPRWRLFSRGSRA